MYWILLQLEKNAISFDWSSVIKILNIKTWVVRVSGILTEVIQNQEGMTLLLTGFLSLAIHLLLKMISVVKALFHVSQYFQNLYWNIHKHIYLYISIFIYITIINGCSCCTKRHMHVIYVYRISVKHLLEWCKMIQN